MQQEFPKPRLVSAMISGSFKSEKTSSPRSYFTVDLESLLSDASGWHKKFLDLSAEFEAYKSSVSSDRSSPSQKGAAGLRYLLPEVDQEVVLSLRTQISELQDKVRGENADQHKCVLTRCFICSCASGGRAQVPVAGEGRP